LRDPVGQQCPAGCEAGGALSVGEEHVVADAVNAVWQSVQQETANEFTDV
jgi:hypothetical protein